MWGISRYISISTSQGSEDGLIYFEHSGGKKSVVEV